MGVKAMLPSYELGFYALVVTCAVLYSGSGIFEASRGNVPTPPGREVPAFTALHASSLKFRREQLGNPF